MIFYVVLKGVMVFWEKRFEKFNVLYIKIECFGEWYVEFDDLYGLYLEIVEREEGEVNVWMFGDIIFDVVIKGFGGVILLLV